MAQQIPVKSIAAGLMLSRHIVKDQGMSALTYRGFYPGISVHVIQQGQHFEQEIVAGIAGGKLQDKNRFNELSGRAFRLNYQALFVMGQVSSVSFKLGGVLDNYLNTRENTAYVNKRNYYELVSSISPALQLSYDFGRVKAEQSMLRLKTTVFTPVIAALSRSGSARNRVNDFPSPSFKTALKNTNFVSLDRYIRFDLDAELQFLISQRSNLSIAYQWNYYQIKEYNQVQSATSTVMVKYAFSL